MMKRIIWLLLFLTFISSRTLAQLDCPAIVEVALDTTRRDCDETMLNEACYGISFIEAEARQEVSNFTFETSGDTVAILDLQSMRLSAMDTEQGTWGIALMEVQANTSDREEEIEGATILLFGDTAIQNAEQLIAIETTQNTPVYQFPDTQSEVLEDIADGTPIIANGLLETNDWIRVWLPQGVAGWLMIDAMTTTEDINTLVKVPVLEAMMPLKTTSTSQYGPMQAFYFESGMNDSPCDEAPESGVLIQTPEGEASVTIWMDEVVVQLEGTVYVQAQEDDLMELYLIDGSAQIEAEEETRTALEGTVITVPLDENLLADGVPSEPQPYSMSDVAVLPTSLLPNPVAAAPPSEWEQGVPVAGTWIFGWNVDQMVCPDGTIVPFEVVDLTTNVSVSGDTMNMLGIPYVQLGTGIYGALYTDEIGNVYQNTVNVSAQDRMIGESVIDFGICTLTAPFFLQLARPDNN
jgi:hypothetical protein